MRSAPWLCLSVVMIAGLQAPSAHAKSVPGGAARRPVLQREFVGYGTTEQDAKMQALERARDWLAENRPFDWTPPPGYLLDRNMVRFSEPTEQEFQLAGPMKVVKMELTVNAGQAEEIQRVAREQRMKQRQWLSGCVLVGVLALLLVTAGYLRLEEATKGYYTRRLRVTAVILLVLVGALLAVVG